MKSISQLLLASVALIAGIGTVGRSSQARAADEFLYPSYHSTVTYYTVYYRVSVYDPWIPYYSFVNPNDAAYYANAIWIGYGFETYTYVWQQ